MPASTRSSPLRLLRSILVAAVPLMMAPSIGSALQRRQAPRLRQRAEGDVDAGIEGDRAVAVAGPGEREGFLAEDRDVAAAGAHEPPGHALPFEIVGLRQRRVEHR